MNNQIDARITRLKKLADERGDGLITVSFKDGSKQYLAGGECVKLFMGEQFDTVAHFKANGKGHGALPDLLNGMLEN